jgi:hypothetical protein
MRLLIPCLIVLLLLLTGCSGLNTTEVQLFVDEVYDNLNNQSYDKIVPVLDDRWLKSTNESKTIDFLSKLHNKTGVVNSYSLMSWNAKIGMAVGGRSGTTYVLGYYSNRTNMMTRDTFTIFNPMDTNDFYIMGYNVNSPDLI